MSELNAFIARNIDDGTCDPVPCVAVYLKDEADKVITELKDKLQNVSSLLKETREWLVESQKLHKRCADNAVKVIRHNKYKRCLDKAAMCEARYDEEDAKVNGSGMSWEYISKEMKYWERWRWRWEALAEKFKPNSISHNSAMRAK